ncbi:hypothetical protein [Bradyrhizobium lablabi]|uniref:hypothetical protein n=1 Tax=Bradyrhizobium lablabi TaxID=722472 RepID=UPI0009A8CB28|nr:hypothetical protein [Bradyrhizobium lablabi]
MNDRFAPEAKLKFTGQVRQNRLNSMDARDQRDRQQFHEAKIFDAVQAPVLTGSIDAALLRAFIENIEIGASREVPKAAALDDLRGYRRLAASERSHRFTQDPLRMSRSPRVISSFFLGRFGRNGEALE